ncbi:MAG: histidine phosphatase family protein [Dehalococcoidia bacterium]|nr:histidine phosphatase family protein [Dehalococcoidia bacterium]
MDSTPPPSFYRAGTTRVLLIRHGETYGNIEQRFCGHSETDLTPLGVAQARALGERLRSAEIDAAYASDLSRAAKTAEYALEHRPQLSPVLDPAFREMHYGEWESRPGPEIGKENPVLLADFFRGKVHGAPGGETVQQLRQRTAEGMRRVVAENRGASLMVVSHGNAIAAMLAELLDMPVESTWAFAVTNTSITRLQFSKSGRVTVVSVNDAAHTEGLTAGASSTVRA